MRRKYSRVRINCYKNIIRKIPIYCEQYRNLTRNELEEKLNQLVSDGWNFFQIIIDSKEQQKISIDKNPDLQTESASSEKMPTKSHRRCGERPGNNGIHRFKREKKHPKCPECGSGEDIIPIEYGFASSDMFEDEKRGMMKIGGCTVREDNPDFYCKSCDISFKEK